MLTVVRKSSLIPSMAHQGAAAGPSRRHRSRARAREQFRIHPLLLSNVVCINIDRAINGYIQVMKSKPFIARRTISIIDDRIEEIEWNFKTKNQVENIDYDFTDSDSSSGIDSPPEAKQPKLDVNLSGPSKEIYLNKLEKILRTLIVDELYPTNLDKKMALRFFFKISNMTIEEIDSFLVPLEDVHNED
ncbi:hypothetical protein V9T40_003163 [Parthenolecanium corni]|uniref:Uncharacterized protein n=1 Tax=Parthenolecanium corni TaxID=536013 RepID=A0AAN9U0S6_9HEMI